MRVSAPRALVASILVPALRLIGAALWRLQASHLVVFVLAPAMAAVAQAALALILLPFALGGFGDRSMGDGHPLAHLREPACWVMLAPCPFADSALFALPQADATATATDDAAERFLPPPSAFTVRHAWLVAWLAWFAWFLARREVKRGPPDA